MSEKLVQLT